MAKATRVLSTPPTNTSLSRRHMLAGLAVLPAGTVAFPAGAAGPDPVFAAIEAHKVHCAEYTAAVDLVAYTEVDAEDYEDLFEQSSSGTTLYFERMQALFDTRPTTVAGVATLLRYIAGLEDWQMLPGIEDGDGKENAQALCASLASALEQIGGAA